jgi:DNA-binding NarL/FixJ family response regulator
VNARPVRLADTAADGASTPRIRVLVVAGVRLYRDGVASNLGHRDNLTVVGAAATGEEVLGLVASLRPDVVVLDMGMSDSLEVARAISAEAPAARVVAFAVEDIDLKVLACAEAGVAGYVPREASMNDLVATIEQVTRGELNCSPRIVASLFRHVASLASKVRTSAGGADLTRREREVLALIDAGLSNKEIAVRLHIEVSTVKNHVHNLLEKVQATSRSQAAAQLRPRLP